MHPISILIFLVIGPVMALYIGCLGVELVEETILGWLLILVGASYPTGAVITYYRRTYPRKHL